MTVAVDRVRDLVSESIYDNPVVIREFRTRMRGWKAFMVMGSYALLLAGVLFIAFMSMWNSRVGPSGSLQLTDRRIGMDLFIVLAWTQAILLSLILPSLTFSSITQELERKTIELLVLTRLTPGKITIGKQIAGFLYGLVLMICSIPLASMCLMFGGISPAEIALWYVVLAAWCFLLTCAGVFWSSLFLKTATAALFTYGTALGYFLFTAPFGVPNMQLFGSAHDLHVFGALNPAMAAYASASATKVCSWSVPMSIPPLVLHVSLGVLLMLVASTHVKHQRAERALPIRLMLMLVTSLLIWFLVGDRTSTSGLTGYPGGMMDLISIVSGVILGYIALFTCAIASGEPKPAPGKSVMAYALSFRSIFRSELGGAVPFILLWTVIAYATLGGTLFWSASAHGAKLAADVWPAYFHVGVAVVVMSSAIAAVGVLGSCLVRQRKNAAALVLLFLIVAFAGYGISMICYVPGTGQPQPFWQLAAFWPITPLIGSTGQWTGMPQLWWEPKDSWIVTSIAYFGIGALALGLATRALRRTGGVREE